MSKIKLSIENLSDEEILKEFVSRFNCDAAILVYKESSAEFGFGRWNNSTGKKWVNQLFSKIKQESIIAVDSSQV